MKIMSICGARPNFIKMSPVIREIQNRNIDHVFVHTGQHYDRELSEIFLEELKLPALDYYLKIGSGTHGYQTGKMLIEIEKVLLREKPDVVLVPGDTNTALAGALSSAKLHIAVGHVEAGLRGFMWQPEEINRILVDHCSDFLFCPTKTSVENLGNEGISPKIIYLTGDPMVEACYQNLEVAREKSKITKEHGIDNGYILVTMHRCETVDMYDKIKEIVRGLLELSIEHSIIFPIHPRTEKMLKRFKLYHQLKDKVMIIPPVGYFDFLMLLSNAKLIITDSGGAVREAFFLRVPCVTIKETTEWVETINLGYNIIAGRNAKKLVTCVNKMINSKLDNVGNPYGDGKASKRIVDILINKLGGI